MLTTTINDIKNNAAFDLDVLESVIEDIKLTSFTNLYNFQKDLAGIKRFDLTMNQLIPMNNLNGQRRLFTKKYIGFVPTDFIHKSKRLAYKRSKFYNKEISIFDVANNSKIFSYSYMVFIDGKFVDSVNILPKEEKTAIIVDIQDPTNPVGIPKTHFETLKTNNAKITVFFVPNSMYGTYNTTRADLLKHKDTLALSELNLAGNLTTDANYITFVNNQNLLFGSVATDTTNSANMLRFTNNSGLPTTNKKIHINVFGFRHLNKQLQLSGTEKFFRLDGHNMPVPVENLMVFKNDGSNLKSFAHEITLKQYYPNVYEVIGNDSNAPLTIYVFYSKDNPAGILKYKNDLDVYEKFNGLSVASYKDGTVPAIIKDYTPQSFEYSIDDFNSSPDFPDHLAYKLKKFSGWVDNDPELLKQYLLKQLKSQDSYYLDMANVDLASKLRTNNLEEISHEPSQEQFGENRYVFIVKNEPNENYQNFRFYIDGFAHIPDKRWREGLYEIFYIPATLVTQTSIIEIERFTKFNFEALVTFASTTENEQWQVGLKNLTPQDIILYDNTTKEIIGRDKFSISYLNKGVKTPLSESSFKVIPDGKFIINMKDTNLLNKEMVIKIQRDTYYDFHDIDSAPEAGASFTFTHDVNPDERHFRIFRNGRMLSQNLYKIESSKTYGGANFVSPLIYKEMGDKYIVDYTPNKYKVVYEQPTIGADGVIDLRGKIGRPFDLKWYDIYVNGRRLTKNHLDIISPFILIVKNISSLKNLLIVERDKDEDFISVSPDTKTIIEDLWDTDTSFKDLIMTNRPSISDTEPDVVTEIISEQSLELYRFFDSVMSSLTHIDADTNQLSDEDKANYPTLFDGDVLVINPDVDLSENSYVMKLFND